MKYGTIVFLFLMSLLFPLAGKTQEIDNTLSYRNIAATGYIRGSTDNDYFTGTDKEYTEGVNFEVVAPWVAKFPLSKLLAYPRFDNTRFGLGIEQAGYTPNDLGNTELQTKDHPFAATLFLKTFVITTDTVHKQRFATTLVTGVIGPAALGDKIQDGVHAIIGDVVPSDWHYQLQNDVLLNYQINYQKQLVRVGNAILIDAEGMARAGTFSDKAGAGIDIMLGYIQSPYGDKDYGSHVHFFIYDNPEVEAVAFDATLEGGVFDHNNKYFIPSSDLSHVTFTNRLGAVLTYKRTTIEYDETLLTRQYVNNTNHLWGSITLGLTLR